MYACMTQGLRKLSAFHYCKETNVVKKLNFYFIQGYESAYYFLQLAGTNGGGGAEVKADTKRTVRPYVLLQRKMSVLD